MSLFYWGCFVHELFMAGVACTAVAFILAGRALLRSVSGAGHLRRSALPSDVSSRGDFWAQHYVPNVAIAGTSGSFRLKKLKKESVV